MREPDALDRRLDAPERFAAARRGDDAEVLASREVAVEARLLDDRADAGECLGAPLGHRQPAQAHRAAVRAREAEQDSDERRLAGAVRAEVAEGDAARDPEVDALENRTAAEALRQAVRLDDGFVLGHRATIPAE